MARIGSYLEKVALRSSKGFTTGVSYRLLVVSRRNGLRTTDHGLFRYLLIRMRQLGANKEVGFVLTVKNKEFIHNG